MTQPTILFHLFYAMVEKSYNSINIWSFCHFPKDILIKQKQKTCLVPSHINHFVYYSLATSLLLGPPSILGRLVLALLLWSYFTCRECQPTLDLSDKYSGSFLGRQTGVVNTFISPNCQSQGFLSCFSVIALEELKVFL